MGHTVRSRAKAHRVLVGKVVELDALGDYIGWSVTGEGGRS